MSTFSIVYFKAGILRDWRFQAGSFQEVVGIVKRREVKDSEVVKIERLPEPEPR